MRPKDNHHFRHRRPFSVTLLALGVLTLASLNLIRFLEASRQWDFLVRQISISPLYLASSGLFWGLLGLLLTLGLWIGWRHTPNFAFGAALVYSGYYWIDRFVIAASTEPDWPFAIGLNGLLIAILVWVFTRPTVQAFFVK